jgi:hypothetical protein
MASMERQGLIQPIVVRPLLSKFQVVCGERRMQAAGHLGWDRITCLVLEGSVTAETEVADAAIRIAENTARRAATVWMQLCSIRPIAALKFDQQEGEAMRTRMAEAMCLSARKVDCYMVAARRIDPKVFELAENVERKKLDRLTWAFLVEDLARRSGTDVQMRAFCGVLGMEVPEEYREVRAPKSQGEGPKSDVSVAFQPRRRSPLRIDTAKIGLTASPSGTLSIRVESAMGTRIGDLIDLSDESATKAETKVVATVRVLREIQRQIHREVVALAKEKQECVASLPEHLRAEIEEAVAIARDVVGGEVAAETGGAAADPGEAVAPSTAGTPPGVPLSVGSGMPSDAPAVSSNGTNRSRAAGMMSAPWPAGVIPETRSRPQRPSLVISPSQRG